MVRLTITNFFFAVLQNPQDECQDGNTQLKLKRELQQRKLACNVVAVPRPLALDHFPPYLKDTAATAILAQELKEEIPITVTSTSLKLAHYLQNAAILAQELKEELPITVKSTSLKLAHYPRNTH